MQCLICPREWWILMIHQDDLSSCCNYLVKFKKVNKSLAWTIEPEWYFLFPEWQVDLSTSGCTSTDHGTDWIICSSGVRLIQIDGSDLLTYWKWWRYRNQLIYIHAWGKLYWPGGVLSFLNSFVVIGADCAKWYEAEKKLFMSPVSRPTLSKGTDPKIFL